MQAGGRRQPGEFREYLFAAGRLVASAVQPYPRRWRSTVSAYVIAAAGVAVPTVLGLVTGAPLLALVVAFAVIALLLFVAGVGIERQLHGDSGIWLEPTMSGQWIQLGVWNGLSKTADFTGTVENIEPVPPRGRPPSWEVPWFVGSQSSTGSIAPHDRRYLILGYGEIARRDSDGELAGCIALQSAGQSEVPFNYENTAEFLARKPITITVKVRRHDPPASAEGEFLIEFPSLDGGRLPAHPMIMPVRKPWSTRG
jgi:hypothetical protein